MSQRSTDTVLRATTLTILVLAGLDLVNVVELPDWMPIMMMGILVLVLVVQLRSERSKNRPGSQR